MSPIQTTFYLCRYDHPHDRVYAENILEFFDASGIHARVIELGRDGQRPELLECMREDTIGVLGFNAQLAHSYVGSSKFLNLAERRKLPVIQWVMDHPSTRYHELDGSSATNSRFLFMSEFSRQYFHRYVMPDALTAATVGIGANRLSRIDHLSRPAFFRRDINCLIPLLLKRVGGHIEQIEARMHALEPKANSAVGDAMERAIYDLDHPIETHLLDALDAARLKLHIDTFNTCVQIVEEMIQIQRRTLVLKSARNFPLLVQSDVASRWWGEGATARLEENVDMRLTFERMGRSRAVLSVSHVNDEIHDRTLNGLNAGCVNIVEDNVVHRRVFRHGENALLFRYSDDSMQECLDVVCNNPARSYKIALAGFALRDDPRFRFGGFDNIVKLAKQSLPKYMPTDG
jgi:hypothetical protein